MGEEIVLRPDYGTLGIPAAKLAVELKMHTSKEYGNIIERVGWQLAQEYFNHCSISL